MKNKVLLVIVVLLSIGEVISLKYKSKTNFSLPQKEENNKIVIKDVNNDSLLNEDLEDYVIKVVAAEMPASFNEEALKAQAIASRTYAVYKMKHSNKDYDVTSDTSSQAYATLDELKSKWNDSFTYYYDRVSKAVNDTKGMVMTYNDEVIISYYFAMSNGYTEDAKLVFNEEKPYLKSTESKRENDSLKNFSFEKSFSKNEICNILNINDFVIDDIQRSSTNRVDKIIINNKEFSGTEIRKLLDLRSTDFDISISNNSIIFTTRGYGHGVGLSQYGANLMANDGYNYEQILKHYYNGIEITKI